MFFLIESIKGVSSGEILNGGSTVILCIGSNSDFGKGFYNFLVKVDLLALCDR